VKDTWYQYVGLDGVVVGLERFGFSAPGNVVMEKLGITAQAVVDAVHSLKA
jgi:transketolase